jgi:threonine dehydrogenase-like Zn-dependent dehydrogenase
MDDAEAVAIQSIATVIRAANRLPEVRGRRVAVIGAGPIGLVFLHVLRGRGAVHLSSIDPVPRAGIARRYGADEFVPRRSDGWLATLAPERRPAVVIEAVGHQHATIADALSAVADDGTVYAFGGVDDDTYAVPVREMYERGLTLMSGRTLTRWVEVLEAGRDYLLAHRDDFRGYVTHTIPVDDAQRAYSLYARPQEGRIKVVLVDPDGD